MIIEFLIRNWVSVAVILGLFVYASYLALCNKWEKIRELAYKLMLLAERTFLEADGKVKFDFVVRIVYKNIPGWMRLFLKEQDINQLIQKWYATAKDFLDDGKINNSAAGLFK